MITCLTDPFGLDMGLFGAPRWYSVAFTNLVVIVPCVNAGQVPLNFNFNGIRDLSGNDENRVQIIFHL